MLGQENLTGRISGDIQINDISHSRPRRYNVQCTRCLSKWTELHGDIAHRLNIGLAVSCRNPICYNNLLEAVGTNSPDRQQHREAKRQEAEAAQYDEYLRLRAIFEGGRIDG